MSITETFEISPHSTKQEQIMRAFMNPDLQEMWVPCGTKFGKTLGGASGIAAGAWVKNQGVFRWVGPIYTQSKIGMRYVQRLLPTESYKPNLSEPPSIRLLNTNAIIEFWHGKNPDSLEGEGVSGGYILDEAAKMVKAVYESAVTTVTQTRAPIIGMSTPKGKNFFYEKSMEAKDKMEWAIKNSKPLTHVYITARTEDNPFVPKQSIADARAKMPDRLFRQYYLAEFLDDSAVFVGYRDCIEEMEPILVYEDPISTWLAPGCENSEVVIGADWGKIHDFNVFGAIDYKSRPRRLVGVQRFNGVSYLDAIKQIYRFSKNFKKVGLVKHDMTGVGQGIDDMLAQVNLPVEGVVFTNKSKSEMVNELIMGFEKKELAIPNWHLLIKELDAYEVITTSLGNYRYSAPEGSGIHDDIVSMLILAYSGAVEYGGDFSIRFLEDLAQDRKEGRLNLDNWYRDIIEEEHDSPLPLNFR